MFYKKHKWYGVIMAHAEGKTIQSSEGEYTLTLFADTFKQLQFNQIEELKL